MVLQQEVLTLPSLNIFISGVSSVSREIFKWKTKTLGIWKILETYHQNFVSSWDSNFTMAHHGQKVEYQIYSSGWFCWKIYFFPEFFFLTIVNASKWHTGITCSISQKNVTHVWKIHEKPLKIGVFPSFEGVNEKMYFFPEMK